MDVAFSNEDHLNLLQDMSVDTYGQLFSVRTALTTQMTAFNDLNMDVQNELDRLSDLDTAAATSESMFVDVWVELDSQGHRIEALVKKIICFF